MAEVCRVSEQPGRPAASCAGLSEGGRASPITPGCKGVTVSTAAAAGET